MLYANIIVDITHEKLDKIFQYSVPGALAAQCRAGTCVNIPFGKRTITGYIVELTEQLQYDPAKIRPILSLAENATAIDAQMITLAAWIHKNYGGTMIQALKTVLPVKRKERQKESKQVRLLADLQQAEELYRDCVGKHRTAQARLLEGLLECSPQPYPHLVKDLGISRAAIDKLQEMGVVAVERERYYRNPVVQAEKKEYDIKLNEAQQSAVNTVIQEFDAGIRQTYLLFGVTGSGKTEVYMELIAHVAAQGKQCIMLIPEIALTFQTVRRFYERFGARVSILHSRLSAGERADQLERAKNGDIDIMIGPRSALFTPFSNLGFIIIDEEHETSYKSETVPKYHAREVAIARAKIAGASVVLGSATPSVESYYFAGQGEYKRLSLPLRVQEKPMPECEVIDLRAELRAGNRSIFSGRLQELIEDRLQKKQQVILFLNRRGIAGFVSCRECGSVIRCPHCDVSLSQHQNHRLVCHYCGYEVQMPKACPSCGSKYIGGFRAGTQKIQELAAKRFPQAKILRMDYDTTRTKDSYERILSAFAGHKADILIGTQMIVKGHDFPNVTLVGVLAADLSLNASDHHAAERTFQLLTQAAGRAGRGSEPGNVVIQTYQPGHFSIQAAKRQDYQEFFEEEILYRKLMHYPPVWNMLYILSASPVQEEAGDGIQRIAGWIRRELQKAGADRIWKNLQVVGPAGASVAKINDIYRYVLYMKHPDYQILVKVKDFIEKQIDMEQEKWGRVSVQFDFNPVNSL